MNDIFRELKKDVDFDFGDNDAYTVVSQMLVEWCEARGRRFSDLIIKLKVGDYEDTVFESFDSNNYCFVSDYDWWEGENTIQILDIKRLEDVFNDDKYNKAKTLLKMNDKQKEFLNELGKLLYKYNIDTVCVGKADENELQDIEFWSNNQKLAFYKYTGYKRESLSMLESGRAPIGVFSNVSTFRYEPEYYPEKEVNNNE